MNFLVAKARRTNVFINQIPRAHKGKHTETHTQKPVAQRRRRRRRSKRIKRRRGRMRWQRSSSNNNSVSGPEMGKLNMH